MTNNGESKVDFGLLLLKLMKIDMFQNSNKEPKKWKVEKKLSNWNINTIVQNVCIITFNFKYLYVISKTLIIVMFMDRTMMCLCKTIIGPI